MKAKDIMTTDVVTCSPDTTVAELASEMAQRRISGMPVVVDDKLLGIVSEGDLLRRAELGETERRQSWWLRLLGADTTAGDYVKARGQHARDVMTRDVVTVDENTPINDLAALFESKHIKRVPVLRDNQLVGIVSRANLVQAVAAVVTSPRADHSLDDVAIRESLLGELSKQDWWRGGTNSLTVSNGVVHFWGYYDEEIELDAARVAAENTAGVSGVQEHRSRYPIAYAGA